MKKLVLIIAIISLGVFSCKNTPITVKSVNAYTLTRQIPIEQTTTQVGPNQKGTGTAIGVGMGEWLIGGPVGWIVGGAVGHSVTSDGKITNITYQTIQERWYNVILSNGTGFNTQDSGRYIIGQIYTP